MKYEELSKSILMFVGGKNNIAHLTNCATRLRFNLKDHKKADIPALKKVEGVVDVLEKGGQLQLIIGTDVANVCAAIKKIAGLTDDNQSAGQDNKKILDKILDTVAGIFTPILPAITGAGMLKAFLIIFSMIGVISSDSQTYAALEFISDAAFYFLPVMLAYTSAVKFQCNPFVAISIAGVLLHPSFSGIVAAGENFSMFGLPVALNSYSSSVLPIILVVWFMSYVQKFFDKISPKFIKFFSVPLMTLLVTAPVALILIAPLGGFVGTGLAAVIEWLDGVASWIVPTVIGATFPLLVMTGMHYSLLPVSLNQLALTGTETVFAAGALAPNIGQGAAALCVGLKAKNKKLKSIGYSAGLTAIMGITEPAMYGVNIKLKKPFIAVLIGGAAGGFYAGITGIHTEALITPGLTTLLTYASVGSRNIINAVITVVISFVVTFTLTWILGFEEEEDNSGQNEESADNRAVAADSTGSSIKKTIIASPLSGKTMPLKDVNDAAFSSEALGKGVAVYPNEGRVYAPVDGTVAMVFDTKHALGLVSDDGVEVLIHVGLDTVRLEGKGFTSLVEAGAKVKKGDLLLEFDQQAMEAEGYDMITPVIISNTAQFMEVLSIETKDIKAGEDVVTIIY